MKTILITGGSGLVGRALSELLISRGYTVIWLSRERYVKAEIPRYRWDYTKGEVDEEALQQADVIVHLAGANLSEGAWTRLRKQHIVESRVLSAQLLREKIKALDKKLDAFISASAIGYYGKGITDKIYTEAVRVGNGKLRRNNLRMNSAFVPLCLERVLCFRTKAKQCIK